MTFENNGSMLEPPRLSKRDNFSIWKSRMINFLNSIDIKLMETIKEGRHIPPLVIVPGTHASLTTEVLQIRWSDEDKLRVSLYSKAKHILSVSLSDDIYTSVMYCESAKEMWDKLILHFERTDDTEKRRSILIQQYEYFRYMAPESLTKMYIRFNCLINDLQQHNKTFDNKDMLDKFLKSLPPALSEKATVLRHMTNLSETMPLQDLYELLLIFENACEMKESNTC